MQKIILLSMSLCTFLATTAMAATPTAQHIARQAKQENSDLAQILKSNRCFPNRDTATAEINGYRCLDKDGNLKNEFITTDGRRITFDESAKEIDTRKELSNSISASDRTQRTPAKVQPAQNSGDYKLQLKSLNKKRNAASTAESESTRLDTSSIVKPIIPQKINVAVELNRVINNTNMQMRQDVVLVEGKPISIQGRSPSNKRMVIQLAATIPDKTQPNSIQVSSRIYEYVNGKPVLISSPKLITQDNTLATIESAGEDKTTSVSLKIKPRIITAE